MSRISRPFLALALVCGAAGVRALPAYGAAGGALGDRPLPAYGAAGGALGDRPLPAADGVVGVGVVIPERDRAKGVILAQDDVRLYCRETNGWTFALSQTTREAGVREFRLTLARDAAALPPAFRFEVTSLKTDMQYAWTPAYGCAGRLGIPSWANWYSVSRQIPVVSRFNGSDRNRLALATSETRREITFATGHSEDDFSCSDSIRFFEGVKSVTNRYEVSFRIDRRDVFWSRAIEDAVLWVGAASGERPPCVPPDAAYEPLYSTWYNFHQDITGAILARELPIAADLGLKTVILDDGWQMDVAGRGYRYCGDWEVSKKRFPDMAEHVRRVHKLGMKYMVWFSIPFVGYESKAYTRFRDKFLYTDDRMGAGALDPRFPEVRAYLADVYERVLRDWDIDGFKLDFIDQIETRDKPDPAVRQNYAGRDYRSIPDAVDRLLRDATERLRAIKPDLLFEFRQAYIGPAIRQYGNMMRVGDCPTSLAANRVGTVNLRLMCPGSAVHGDMIKWTADDTPEQAARYVLSSIFGVVQYSAELAKLKAPYLKMIRHWIGFSEAHRAALLKGTITPHHAECDYPVVEATDDAERIVLVSSVGFVASLKTDLPLYVLNNTGEDGLLVESPASFTAEVFDTFGALRGRITVPAGISRVRVPASGYLTSRRSDLAYAEKYPNFLVWDPSSPISADDAVAAYRMMRVKKTPTDFHASTRKLGNLDARLAEYVRQQNLDGQLGKEVPLGSRLTSDADRASCEKIFLWPEGKTPDFESGQCAPYIEWHLPTTLTTKAIMLVFSGGGYHGNSPDGNSVPPVRRFLNGKGMAVATLKYREPRSRHLVKHVAPWQDLQRAIRLVRAGAAARGLDPNRIGVYGGSAGGHLALLGALSSTKAAYAPIDAIDRQPCNVQLAVSLFPAYVLSDGIDCCNRTGGNCSDVTIVDELAFDARTAPVLFLHGDGDPYSAMGSALVWQRLQKMGVHSEIHTFARRGHDFQYSAAPGTASYDWLEIVWEFLSKCNFRHNHL